MMKHPFVTCILLFVLHTTAMEKEENGKKYVIAPWQSLPEEMLLYLASFVGTPVKRYTSDEKILNTLRRFFMVFDKKPSERFRDIEFLIEYLPKTIQNDLGLLTKNVLALNSVHKWEWFKKKWENVDFLAKTDCHRYPIPLFHIALYAIQHHAPENFIDFLLAKKAPLNIIRGLNASPLLSEALMHKNIGAAKKILLQYSVNNQNVDNFSNTPALYAVMTGDRELIKETLIDKPKILSLLTHALAQRDTKTVTDLYPVLDIHELAHYPGDTQFRLFLHNLAAYPDEFFTRRLLAEHKKHFTGYDMQILTEEAVARRNASLAWWLLEEKKVTPTVTMIVTAIAKRMEDLAQLLLSKPHDTHLIFASLFSLNKKRAVRIFNFLMTKGGASPNAPLSGITKSFLFDALERGAHELAQKAIEYGADIENGESISGTTPLMRACSMGHKSLPIVQLLLAKGAKIHRKNKYGRTALHYAASNANDYERAYIPLIELLLSHGADPNALDKEGNSPLYHAVGKNPASLETVQLLIHADADLEHQKNAMLHRASLYGNIPLIEFLLRHKANPNASIEGNVPLHHLCFPWKNYSLEDEKGSRTAARLLLKAGANINARNAEGKTPLHFLTEYRPDSWVPRKLIRFFIRQGAQINTWDHSGATPLICACKRGNKKVVASLLRHGADPLITDREGMNALMHVQEQECAKNRFSLHYYDPSPLVNLLVRYAYHTKT